MNVMLCIYLLLAVASFAICFYIFSVMKLAFTSSLTTNKGPGLVIVLGMMMALAITVGVGMLAMAYRVVHYLMYYT